MAQSAADDPIVNAVVSPQASRFVRLILRSALDTPTPDLTPDEIAEAQALFANVIMNDVLNWWNTDLKENVHDAQISANNALTHDPKLSLALHARGLVNRALKDPSGALSDFQQAVTQDPNFARAYAQVGNQKALDNLIDPQKDNPHGDFTNARRVAPNHPALGYFDWGEGRLYFIEAVSGTAPWSKAICCLQKSVNELPTVWYNRCYLAAAQHSSSDPLANAAAPQTVQDFINDPRFDQATFTQIKQLKPDPKDPVRKRVLDFVQPLLP
jgi:tetratricopeptide (TPR) repeat protein